MKKETRLQCGHSNLVDILNCRGQMIRSSLMERVISFSTLYTYLLQGPSWQSVSFRLTFKDWKMKVRFFEGCFVILRFDIFRHHHEFSWNAYCATANQPKSDDRYAQLTKGAVIINSFLQNLHFGWSRFFDFQLFY